MRDAVAYKFSLLSRQLRERGKEIYYRRKNLSRPSDGNLAVLSRGNNESPDLIESLRGISDKSGGTETDGAPKHYFRFVAQILAIFFSLSFCSPSSIAPSSYERVSRTQTPRIPLSSIRVQ